jgi:hypothetical protein
MSFKERVVKKLGFNKQNRRFVVNFFSQLPDATVFTIQVANLELYEDVSIMGNVDIFNSGGDNTIRDDFAHSFFGRLMLSLDLKTSQYKRLVHSHFTHSGDDVTYAVYNISSDIKSTLPANSSSHELYYVFYLRKVNASGVLVWLQIPISKNYQDGRSKISLIKREWEIQNNFFNSLIVNDF